MDDDFTACVLHLEYPFIGTAIMHLRPQVEIVNHGLSIHCHVEHAQSFGIVLTIPWFDEIEFHAIATGGGRETEAQIVTAKTRTLEEWR